MIRSFIVALVTTVIVAAAGPLGGIAAQPVNSTFEPYPLEFVGGAPGVSVEIFLNAGKVGDTTINSTGGGNWLLDMGNSGKTRVQIYIDVCKDGKIVKVLFVTGGGQPPPKDEDCDRRLAAVSFESDCGVTRITLNFANFGANVLGCGGLSFRDPKVIGTAGGAAVLVAVLAGGGGDSTTPSTFSTTPTPPATSTPQTPQTPSTNTPPPPAPPPQITQVTPRFFLVLVNHPSGASTSFICGIVQIDPPVSGVTFALAGSGPAVLPNQNITGTFNSNGQAAFRLGIGQTGQYTLTLTTNNQGSTQTATTTVTVTSTSFNCPTVPS